MQFVSGTAPKPYGGNIADRLYDAIALPMSNLSSNSLPQLVDRKVTRARAQEVINLLNTEDLENTRKAVDLLEGIFLAYGDDVRFGIIPQAEGNARQCTGACAFERDILVTDVFRLEKLHRVEPHFALPPQLKHWVLVILHEFGHVLQWRGAGKYKPKLNQSDTFTREQERETDMFARRFMEKAGYVLPADLFFAS